MIHNDDILNWNSFEPIFGRGIYQISWSSLTKILLQDNTLHVIIPVQSEFYDN